MSENKPLPPPRTLLVTAADRGRLERQHPEAFRHPWNPNSEMYGCMLSRQVGLQRVGVNLIRVPPGKESFAFHTHHVEEEFAFVLCGKGAVDIGEETFEVGPGDFVGFPAGGHAHQLRNPGPEPLVYLSGGENAPLEIGDFPRLGRRMVRMASEVTSYPTALGEPFPMPK